MLICHGSLHSGTPFPATSASPAARAAAPALTAAPAARTAWLSTGAATAAATAGLSTSKKKKTKDFTFDTGFCVALFFWLLLLIHQVYNMYNNWYEATMKPPRRLLKLYQLPTRQNELPTWSVATATPRFTCEAADGMNFHLRCGVSVYFKIYTPIFHLVYKKIYNSSK